MKRSRLLVATVAVLSAACSVEAREQRSRSELQKWADGECQDKVRLRLTSPLEAKFASGADSARVVGDSHVVVRSWFDAPDSAGTMVRSDFECELTKNDDEWKLTNLVVNERPAVGDTLR